MIALDIKEAILEVVKAHEERYGFIDYITLSSSLLFSMKYVTNFDELTKQTFYNVVRQNEFNADGYLEGVEVVSKDYKRVVSRLQKIRLMCVFSRSSISLN